MDEKKTVKVNRLISEEAAEWLVELRSGDLDTAEKREFDFWIRQSPEHLAAYLEMAAIWNEGSSLDPSLKWDTETLIAQGASAPDNVVAIHRDPDRESSPRGPVDPRAFAGTDSRESPRGHTASVWRGRQAVAASIAALGVAAGLLGWYRAHTPTYATGLGEQRSFTLADGSLIEIDSRSEVAVRFNSRERNVDLIRGQALFHVAKDHLRPFIVNCGSARVRAVGTQFDVDRRASGTVVTVVEGRVAVLPTSADPGVSTVTVPAESTSPLSGRSVESSNSSPSTLFVDAGEQLTVVGANANRSSNPNIANATAWTHRQLAFESASLADVAEEFNRYNERQLIVLDAALYNFHITGVFSSTDPSTFIQFLRGRPGVRVVETASEIRVSRNIS
jgi:transmembrane sensor